MELHFFKLDGAGNDFVAIDARQTPLPAGDLLAPFVRRLCHRQKGVGADGLLAVLPPTSPDAHFRMLYVNADGSIGEMCGNGARCAVVFAHHLGAAPASGIIFDTDAGLYRAEITASGSRISFPDIDFLPHQATLEGTARPVPHAMFLRCGVPHAVIFVEEDLDLLDVATHGRAIRHDPAFAPAGTNANFAMEKEPGVLHVRTYERGVEAETLACGTGSVASCACRAFRAGLHGTSDWKVIPTGGEALHIRLTATGTGFTDISLAGPARIVFEGHLRNGR